MTDEERDSAAEVDEQRRPNRHEDEQDESSQGSETGDSEVEEQRIPNRRDEEDDEDSEVEEQRIPNR